MKREPRVYPLADRPDVEVLVDDAWRPGELRMWKPAGEEDWVAQVQWQPAGEHTRWIDDFAAADVRPVATEPEPSVK